MLVHNQSSGEIQLFSYSVKCFHLGENRNCYVELKQIMLSGNFLLNKNIKITVFRNFLKDMSTYCDETFTT